jgi:predicted mannosyl-3-phosphoglycerate phosphatase (HAD superfamily)
MSKRRLSLISRDALRGIVRTSVDRSLERGADGDLADRLVREMVRAIRAAGRSVQGMTRSDVISELERANHEIVKARDRARSEMQAIEQSAGLHRSLLTDTHDALAKIVDAGAALREKRAQNEVDHLFERAQKDGLSFDTLRIYVNALVLEASRRERKELLDGLQAERDRQIDVLERRVAKLNHSLELSEAALRDLAARKNFDEGLASIYRTVQGLSDEEADLTRKRMMLERLFQANVELREQFAGRGDSDYVLPTPAG